MKENTAASRSADKYIVRLPDGMRDALAAAAKGNNRSMNAEIVARLQATFEAVENEVTLQEQSLDTINKTLRGVVREEIQQAVRDFFASPPKGFSLTNSKDDEPPPEQVHNNAPEPVNDDQDWDDRSANQTDPS